MHPPPISISTLKDPAPWPWPMHIKIDPWSKDGPIRFFSLENLKHALEKRGRLEANQSSPDALEKP